MCAYNGLNGTYACADPVSLGKWLHDELNYQGWVLSDFGSVYAGTEIDAANYGLDSVIGATTPPFGRGGARGPSMCIFTWYADLQTHSEITAPFPAPSPMAPSPPPA